MARYSTLAAAIIGTVSCVAISTPAQAQPRQFNVPAGPLKDSLNAFISQSGMQLIYRAEDLGNARSGRVVGNYESAEALRRLLQGTGFKAVRDSSGAQAIVRLEAPGESDAGSDSASSSGEEAAQSATSEILVVGSRSQNADIRRTESDSQPYVVFGGDEIRNSQATTAEEFLRTRLPMNSSSGTAAQTRPSSASDSRSQIDLRALGPNQTLILIDGRRVPGSYSFSGSGTLDFSQPDINGIPLASIERIEILPATAGGIYGGGATGGVVNVILKRDFRGLDINATVGGTFDGHAINRRIELTGGATLAPGLSVNISGSYQKADPLLARHRSFLQRGRELDFENAPEVFTFVPPTGYTTNIQSLTGAPLVLDNGTPLGSAFTYVPVGYAGPASDGGQALVGNAGRYNLDFSDDAFGLQQQLLSSPTVTTALVGARYQITPWLRFVGDVSWIRKRDKSPVLAYPFGNPLFIPADAPNNPFNDDILVAFPAPSVNFENRTLDTSIRFTGGLVADLSRSWKFGLDYVYNKIKTDVRSAQFGLTSEADNAFVDGTLNVLADVNRFSPDYLPFILQQPSAHYGPQFTTLNDVTLRFSGNLFAVPAGHVALNGYIEYRREAAVGSFNDSLFPWGLRSALYVPPRSQSDRAAYAELHVPIFASESNSPFAQSLELMAALRADSYETRSAPSSISVQDRDDPLPDVNSSTNHVHSVNYTAALRYQPFDGLMIRASWGTGFLPPSIGQIVSNFPNLTPSFFFGNFSDPRRGGLGQVTNVLVTNGGRQDLAPEESNSLSAGVVLTPTTDLRLSVDYIRIKKGNEIIAPQYQQIVDLEDLFPDRVVRGANLPGDQPGWAGPITELDITLVNLARSRVEAMDFNADYRVTTNKLGNLHFYGSATHNLSLERQFTPDAPSIERAGFRDGPLKWRGNLGLDWTYNSFTVGWNAQFYGRYLVYNSTSSAAVQDSVAANQGARHIPAQVYQDVFAKYKFGGGSLMGGAEITIGVQNLFNHRPPTIALGGGSFGGYSTYGDPRMRRFSLGIRRSF